MPSPLYIRKQILEALQTEIIPQLQQQSFAQLIGGAPICFKGTTPVIMHKPLVADQQQHPLEIMSRWPQHQLFSKRINRLGVLYRGATQEFFGITEQMAFGCSTARQKTLVGVTSFHLQAPAIYVVPPNVPHNGKVHSASASEEGITRLLMFHFNTSELFLNLADNGRATHYLHLLHPAIIASLQQSIEVARGGNTTGAQLLLLTAMQGVQSYLEANYPGISNSSWSALGERVVAIPVHATEKNTRLCHQAIDYIQFHLHEPLTLNTLAAHCGVSKGHLNRIFKQEIGITLMRFITLSRIEAAKGILRRTDERIGDVAKLVGFSSSHSFDGIFRRHEKITPTDYRKLQAAVMKENNAK